MPYLLHERQRIEPNGRLTLAFFAFGFTSESDFESDLALLAGSGGRDNGSDDDLDSESFSVSFGPSLVAAGVVELVGDVSNFVIVGKFSFTLGNLSASCSTVRSTVC